MLDEYFLWEKKIQTWQDLFKSTSIQAWWWCYDYDQNGDIIFWKIFKQPADDEYGSIFLLSIFQNMLFPMQLSQQPLEEDLQLGTVTNSEPSNIS